jgi:site-specific recombinase XerD
MLYAQGFQAELEARGFASTSVGFRLRQLKALNRWLIDSHLTVHDLDSACVDRLVASRRAKGLATFVSTANFSLLLSYLRDADVALPEKIDEVGRLLDRYRAYLVTERALAPTSIRNTVHVADLFCRDLEARHRRPEDLSAGDVATYVVAVCERSSMGWSKKTVAGLGSFLRFLHVSGVTSKPLRDALPKVAGHRRTLPCELTEGDVGRLLSGCDRSRDVGLRDHAIVMLLWRLGIRADEVARLTVNDIDWRRGEITIRGKGNRRELLPLPVDVGQAVVAYLRDGRHRVPPGCRALFVQVRAPEGAMTSQGVSDVVFRLARRVGTAAIGPHRLRHGAATQMVRHGASWAEVAQVLRHRNMAVTVSYITVDPALMAELARPWPGAR